MENKYRIWITNYITANNGIVYGRCVDASKKMVADFPELKVVPGFIETSYTTDEHCWCVTSDGEIIDPTRAQYQGQLILEYRAFKPGDRVRVGKCMECGEIITMAVQSLEVPTLAPHHPFCSIDCNDSFIADQIRTFS